MDFFLLSDTRCYQGALIGRRAMPIYEVSPVARPSVCLARIAIDSAVSWNAEEARHGDASSRSRLSEYVVTPMSARFTTAGYERTNAASFSGLGQLCDPSSDEPFRYI